MSPKLSDSDISPRSEHSIAKAAVAPAEMVSIPRSSHSRAARRMASRSPTPQSGPSAKSDSYSSRTPVSCLPSPVSCLPSPVS